MTPTDTVEVWTVPFSLTEDTVKCLEACLDSEERSKSGQHLAANRRQRYFISRGALRMILARHLGTRPEDIVFGYGPQGKPFFAAPSNTSGLSFSLSHCSEATVIAVAASGRVGVDIEGLRAIPDLDRIAESYFSVEECRNIGLETGSQRIRAFLRIWTRREAVAKAFGLDLSEALAGAGPPLYPPGGSAHLDRNGEWYLTDLYLGMHLIGALCAERVLCQIAYRDFSSLFPP